MPNPGRRSPLPYRAARPKSRLCNRCSVNLEFNDKELGGYEGRDENGRPILKFDDDWTHREFVRPIKIWDNLPRLPLLKASADAGCDFCRLLRRVICQDPRLRDVVERAMIELKYIWSNVGDVWGEQDYLRYEQPQGAFPGLTALAATVHCLVPRNRDLPAFVFWISSDYESIRNWLQCERPLGRTALCTDNVAWIQQEIQQHQRIQSFQPSSGAQSFLPTRLIEISSAPNSPSLRLIHTTDTLAQISTITYAALSYCWGPEDISRPQLKTTEITLHDFMDSIPLQEITPVVKDALKVCNALSIKYLWVDSLCIVQGCKDDWENESEMMAQIFGNAHVTICALSSSSYRESFLRRSHEVVSISFESRVTEDIKGTLLINPAKSPSKSLASLNDSAITMDTDNSLWSDRGWVFQEQLYSRRLLLFGKDRIHLFHGSDRYAAEGSLFADHASILIFFPLQLDISTNAGSTSGLHSRFYECTTVLSGRSFTVPDDRLPAMSGLAKNLAGYLDDVYLAGLWEKSLHYGLLWRTKPLSHSIYYRLKNESVDEPFPLPSWTWASRKEYHEFGTTGTGLSQVKLLRPEYESFDACSFPEASKRFVIREGHLRIETKTKRLPSQFIRTKTATVNPVWIIKQGDAYVAESSFDWDEPALSDDYSSFQMMLLSSSWNGPLRRPVTAGGVLSGQKTDERQEEESNRERGYGSTPIPDIEPPHADNTITQELPNSEHYYLPSSTNTHTSATNTCSEMEDTDSSQEDDVVMIEENHDSSFVEENPPSIFAYINAQHTCETCRDPNHNRHAWGLIICPAEQPGQYYRAGVFTSRALEAGGTRWFEDADLETIELKIEITPTP